MSNYKINEIDAERFYQIPKSLFCNEHYKGLLPTAKLVYVFLKDRMELSRKNHWVADNDEVYLLFTRKAVAELLEISLPTVTKCFKQLNDYKLIEEKKQGLGRPNIIFICHAVNADIKHAPQKEKFFASGNKETLHTDTKKIGTNDTDISNTNLNDTDYKVKEKGLHFEKMTICRCDNQSEVNEVRNYFDFRYEEAYGKKYHKHNFEQNQKIDTALSGYLHEWDIATLKEMIDRYLEVDFDHNLMHFITPGIIQNRMYEIT